METLPRPPLNLLLSNLQVSYYHLHASLLCFCYNGKGASPPGLVPPLVLWSSSLPVLCTLAWSASTLSFLHHHPALSLLASAYQHLNMFKSFILNIPFLSNLMAPFSHWFLFEETYVSASLLLYFPFSVLPTAIWLLPLSLYWNCFQQGHPWVFYCWIQWKLLSHYLPWPVCRSWHFWSFLACWKPISCASRATCSSWTLLPLQASL